MDAGSTDAKCSNGGVDRISSRTGTNDILACGKGDANSALYWNVHKLWIAPVVFAAFLLSGRGRGVMEHDHMGRVDELVGINLD